MNKRNHHYGVLLSILIGMFIATPAHGQYTLKQAAAQAALYNYVQAIPLYNKAYRQEPTVAAARGLAECYLLTKDYVFAESWYAKLLAMPGHTAEDERHYAETLMNNSKYAEAKEVLNSYLSKSGHDTLAINMWKGGDSAVKWMAAPVRGELENVAALNSQWSDWSTAFSNGKVIFASDRPYDSLRRVPFFSNNNIGRKYYGWTGNGYLHLYESDGKDSSSTKLLTRDVNGDYHSATASYTGRRDQFYYALTNVVKMKSSFLGKEVPYTLDIKIAVRQWDSLGHSWKEGTPFPYNEMFKNSVGDPFISPDGKVLYFVADRGEQGYGGTDIYFSRADENGKWLPPVNMGPGINTPGNERTPLLDKSGAFYFASDGRPGMGGLDIYKAVQTGNKEWIVENMGSPVNSPQDDFAPAFDGNATLYFSSNRLGGKGSDDIYRFNPATSLSFSLTGQILDNETGGPLSGVVVTLHNQRTGTVLKTITSAEGKYHFVTDSMADYSLDIAKTGYSTVTAIPVGIGARKPVPDLHLQKAALNKAVKLDNIYFDRDKADIRPDAALELDKLVKLLNDNPTWKVELSSHTDSRAGDNYNLKLSQHRAASTVAYLVSKGIAKDRLTAKGYGETRLLNRCSNGVSCTEEEHQLNRRTTFTIMDK